MAIRTFKIRLAEFAEECADPVEDLIDSLRGAPGVPGIQAQVLSASVDGDDLVGTIEADPKDYIRQCVGYGEESLDVLAQLKRDGMDPDCLQELVEWLRSDPDLTVTIIDTTGGDLRTDQYPTGPGL